MPQPTAISPHEILAVAKTRRILSRYNLASSLDEVMVHCRIMYVLPRRSLQDYIVAMVGRKVACLPVNQFDLYADIAGDHLLHIDEQDANQRLAEYIASHFNQCNIPALVKFRSDYQEFYL